jgi:hypothetical protein
VLFAQQRPARHLLQRGALLTLVFLSIGLANSRTSRGIRPVWVKNKIELAHSYELERWNSYSRIAVHPKADAPPQLWGPSPLAPSSAIPQYRLTIDGMAGTRARPFHSMEDLEHLRYDVTNVGYFLRRQGTVCVIGVGGGRDIQSALLFDAESVTGIDVNPVFIELLQTKFRDFSRVADRDDVELVVDEARSYLSRTESRYDVIQMSLVDTWAATGAGAFSLSENGLYTVEAWSVFLNRLSEDGLFMVSRWHDPENLGETGRLLSLAVRSLLELGTATPSQHLALISSGKISTLLVSRRAFDTEDTALLGEIADEMQYQVGYLPGDTPTNSQLRNILASASDADLAVATEHAYFDYRPPTDNNPYFFNMLRLRGLKQAIVSQPGVIKGNLVATLTLVALLVALAVVAAATIVVPLLLRRRAEPRSDLSPRVFWSGALYFSSIGAGFMFLEIALIQRLSIFLGHPTYALGIILFTIIASTGTGSFLSDQLPLTRRPWMFVYPVVLVAMIAAVHAALATLLSAMFASSMSSRILVSIAAIFPLGVCMGLFFPAGMRLLSEACESETPWYWALNGIFGVLCASLAVFVSIQLGVSTNFWIAAGCYGLVLLPLWIVDGEARTVTAPLVAPAVGAS